MDHLSSGSDDSSRDEPIKRYTRDDIERILAAPVNRKVLFPGLRAIARRLSQPFERLQSFLTVYREKIIAGAVMLATGLLLLGAISGFVRLDNGRIVAAGSEARIRSSGIRVLLVDVEKPLVKVKILEGGKEGDFTWVNAYSLE